MQTPPPFTVLGAGIVGLCTAIRAQQQGFEVTLIDPSQPGLGCSFGNAGHFATEQVFPLADPALLPKLPALLTNPRSPLTVRPGYWFSALPWFARFLWQMRPGPRRHNTRVLRGLCEGALDAWHALLAPLQLTKHVQQKGNLLVFERRHGDAEQVAAAYRKQGVALDILNRAQLDQLCPGLGDSVEAGIWFRDTGHTANPYALSKALFEQFLKSGGHWLQAAVVKIEPGSPHWLTLDTGARFSTQALALCTGIHSKSLCAQLGYPVPLEAERGYHLNTQVPHLPTMAVASYERKFIMTPMDNSLRLAGTVEFAGTNADADPARADTLAEQARNLWPALAEAPDPCRPENRWMGCRPSLPDSLPVISATRWPGLWLNFGHQHLGLTLAAISADWCLALVNGEEHPFSEALSVNRF